MQDESKDRQVRKYKIINRKDYSLTHMWLSHFSRVRLFATPWTVAYQASPSMGFSRQEYWSGLPFPTLGDFPDPGTKLASPACPALAGRFFTTEPPGKREY